MFVRGMSGDNVREIQGLLRETGLYDGMIDGKFEAKTETAVKTMQRANGLKPDGLWGPVTNTHVLNVWAGLNGSTTPQAQPIYPTYSNEEEVY